MNLDDLDTKIMTLAEVEALRRKGPISKGPSRLELAVEATKLQVVDDKAFRKAVIARDGKVCRCCLRKVVQTIARVPERLEVHHLHGRRGVLRHEDRCALVVCRSCHEALTGRVNEKMAAYPTKTLQINGREYADARAPITFRRVA